LADFSIVSLIEICSKGRDWLILDLGLKFSWENHRFRVILEHLSIFEPPEGCLDRNEFKESDCGGSGVRIAMRIKSSISSRRINVCTDSQDGEDSDVWLRIRTGG
jgi:hypothetical protein